MGVCSCSLLFDNGGRSTNDGGQGDGGQSDGGQLDSDAGQQCGWSNIGSIGQGGTLSLTLEAEEVLTIDTGKLSMSLIPGRPMPFEWEDALSEVPVEGFSQHRVVVLSLQELAIKNGATLKAVGPLPLVIVASESVSIAGGIDVSSYSGQLASQGAGGYVGGGVQSPGNTCLDCCMSENPCGASVNPTGIEHGASGGSFGFLGGIIGNFGQDPASPFGTDKLLVPLVGGGSGAGSGVAGGHGGGAIQISAGDSIELLESGRILAGGAGGYGYPAIDAPRGGGGGGAGGAILLEAPELKIDEMAILTVHGGSGGTGNLIDVVGGFGLNGSTGPAELIGTSANQHPGDALEANVSGGAGSNVLGDGDVAHSGSMASPKYGGGGAGGGAGRIRINHRGDPFEKDKAKFYPWVSFSEENNWCPPDGS